MPKLSQILESAESDVEQFLDSAWSFMKPQIKSLGETVLSQVETAAEVFVTSGGNYGEALASVVSQLPADLASLEHIVAGYLSTLIADAQAKVAAAAPTLAVS